VVVAGQLGAGCAISENPTGLSTLIPERGVDVLFHAS
jgi:hypothetical protein